MTTIVVAVVVRCSTGFAVDNDADECRTLSSSDGEQLVDDIAGFRLYASTTGAVW